MMTEGVVLNQRKANNMTNTVSERIDDETLSCAIQIESSGNPNAKARTSSATGLGQFLKATWLGVVRKHRPDLSQRYSESVVLELRKNASLSIEMLARFWEDNADVIGKGAQPGDLYLAHFLGAGTARQVFRAPAMFPVEQIVSKGAVRANESILRGKTCQQVRDWAARRMKQSSGHDWVGKFYNADDPLVAETTQTQPDIADDVVPVKVEEPDVDTRPGGTIAPTDTTPHGKVNDQIANLQKALVAMNYNEVGIVNGAWGGGTRAAIAAFLNDRGMDTIADMSQPVLDELAKARLEGFMRPVSQERANINSKDLAKYNPTMLSTLRTKAVAFWGMITTGGVTVFTALSAEFHSLWDAIAPMRKVLDNVPGFVWVVGAGAVCVLLYFNAHRAERDTTEAFQNRRLLR